MKTFSFAASFKTISQIIVCKEQREDSDIMSRVKGIVADETLGNIHDIPQFTTRRIVKGGFAVKINYDTQDNLIVSILHKEIETIIENRD